MVLGSEQINLIMHNTMYVPGHFHGTVVAGTTLAFMAITYLVVPLVFRREIMFKKLAQWQPYVFGLGVAGISLFMMGAGTLGVSRRHWDITFSDAPVAFDYPGTAFLMMGLNGVFSEGTLKLPGTITLVTIFFVAFVLYYFVNWKFLSEVWPLS